MDPKCHLHGARDVLPVTEDLVEVLGAQDVPQGGLGQQPGTAELWVTHVVEKTLFPIVFIGLHRRKYTLLFHKGI